MWPACGGSRSSHTGVLDFKQQKIIIEDGKGAKDRIVYMSNDAFLALAGYLRVKTSIKIHQNLSGRKRDLYRQSHLHSRHTEAYGVLCWQGETPGFLPSSPAHDGHAAAQCGCRSLHHPGSSWAQQCKDDPAVLPGINLKVQRDYFNAMEVIMQRRVGNPHNP